MRGAARGKLRGIEGFALGDFVELREMRMARIKACTQGFQRIERQFVPKHIGKSA